MQMWTHMNMLTVNKEKHNNCDEHMMLLLIKIDRYCWWCWCRFGWCITFGFSRSLDAVVLNNKTKSFTIEMVECNFPSVMWKTFIYYQCVILGVRTLRDIQCKFNFLWDAKEWQKKNRKIPIYAEKMLRKKVEQFILALYIPQIKKSHNASWC